MTEAKKNYSLLSRITKRILIPVTIGFFITGITSYLVAFHEAEEIYDAQLARSAGVLLSIVEHELEEHGEATFHLEGVKIETKEEYENKLAYRIWYDNAFVASSPNMKNFSPTLPPAGFSDETVEGKMWRVFLLEVKNPPAKIEVAEQYEIRNELIEEVLISIFAPLLLLIPVIIIAVWTGLKTGLIPVLNLSYEVESRDADTLEAIKTKDIPLEIKPLSDSINHLMARVSATLENERQFTDSAAHELRTPLAAIKTTAQVAKNQTTDDELKSQLDDLLLATDRATHLVSQLLDFARLNHDSSPDENLNLSNIIKEAISEHQKQAHEKNINLSYGSEEELNITGSKNTLTILLRNLIDNAIKYTPKGGSVSITTAKKDSHVILRVSDSGIGIPDSEKEKVFERFYRIPGKGKETGCGLGLSIIKSIADRYGADLEITNNPSGKGSVFTVAFKD